MTRPLLHFALALCAASFSAQAACAQDWAPRLLKGHSDWVYSVLFSPDGKYLASAGEDGVLLLRGWPDGEIKAKLSSSGAAITALAYTPDGAQLLAACGDGYLRFWAVGNLVPFRSVRPGRALRALAVSPDGSSVSAGGDDGKIYVLRISSDVPDAVLAPQQLSPVSGLAYTADGSLLLSTYYDGTVRAWSMRDKTLFKEFGRHVGPARAVRAAEGKAFSSGEDGNIMVWDLSTGALERTIKAHNAPIEAFSLSRSGRSIISGGWDGAIRFWSTTGIQAGVDFKTPESGIYSMSLSPDGSYLASSGPSTDIRVWKLSVSESPVDSLIHRLRKAGKRMLGAPAR
ncbi:MAG: WD40 repeat domain-containing protein [Elusimicrobia bacterium]|nr:WD40 repeat domain-containing protein [Elusimicrobiota bacterium]